MKFEELESRWADFDRSLDGVAAELHKRVDAIDAAKSTVRRLTRQVASGVAINALLAIALGLFCARHLGEPQFLIPGVIIDLCVIALLIRGVHQLISLRATDFGSTVIESQRRIETLRLSRIQTNRWTLILAPLMWTPLLIVTLKGVFGLDSYATFETSWFIANTAVGIALTPLLMWISKRFGNRFHEATFAKQLLEDLVGRSRARTAAFLDQLNNFEKGA